MESDEEGPTPVRQVSAYVRREDMERDDKLEKARAFMMEKRASLAGSYLGRGGWDSEYLFVELPSFMAQTEESVDGCYLDEDTYVDIGIKRMIQSGVNLHKVGMEAAPLFLESANRAFTPVSFTSIAELATTLEETTSAPTPEDDEKRKQVQRAIEYAKKSQRFALPKNPSTQSLARRWLTMGEETRSLLLVLTNSAAGSHAFRLLEVAELTVGKPGYDPILTKAELGILGYNYDGELKDTGELLKRFKAAFDDENIPYVDKTTLMLCFLKIKKLLQDMPDDKWAMIDQSGSGQQDDGSEATATRRYFNTSARKNNALMILTMTVGSDYIHEHTFEGVTYGEYNGLASIMYRNSVSFSVTHGGTKLMMSKVYDGTATTKYMEGLHSGLDEMVVKANSDREGGRLNYSDDIPILFHLLAPEREMDDLLSIVGYDNSNNSYLPDTDEDEDEDEYGGDCMEVEEAEYM